MIPHTLHIGEMVADYHNGKWGYIVLINGKKEDCLIDDKTKEAVVTLWAWPRIEDRSHEWETFAEDCYQIEEGKLFNGEIVCKEHFKDEIQWNYPYFCPAEHQNLFEFELD